MPNFATPVQSISNSITESITRRMMQQINKDIAFYSNLVLQTLPHRQNTESNSKESTLRYTFTCSN